MDASIGLLARARSLAAGETRESVVVPPEVRLARTDFSMFCKVLGKENAPHHLEWVDEFITEESSSRLLRVAGPDTAILAPRGSAKSTILCLFVAWLVGIHAQEHRLLRILYLSYSLDVARSKSHTIKAIIESRKYQEIFPTVRLSKTRQSDELWSIDMDLAGIELGGDDPYTICSQGLGGSIVSRRADMIVLDDVVKSQESIQNPEIRAKLITNWQQVVRPCLLDGGRCIALGTRFSTVDIYGTTFNEKHDWKVITKRAIMVDDEGMEFSYWPDMWSLRYLQRLRRSDPTSFSFQFQNQPVSQSALDFPQDWLKKGKMLDSYTSVCVGIDLSSGLKERNDYTVMTLGGLSGKKIDVYAYERVRMMGNLEKIEALCDMLADNNLIVRTEDGYAPGPWTVTIFIEEISYQQSIRGDMLAILHDKYKLHNLVLRGVKGYRGDKLSRFRGTFGHFQLGNVTFNEIWKWEEYWSEFLNFGFTDHDDCVDSFVLMCLGLLGGQAELVWGDWDDVAA